MEILVIDRGPGVSPARRSALLEPMKRLSPEGGASLGLSVASGFLDLLNGELRLEDTPGGGLTVVVQFPLTTPESRSSPRVLPRLSSAMTTSLRCGRSARRPWRRERDDEHGHDDVAGRVDVEVRHEAPERAFECSSVGQKAQNLDRADEEADGDGESGDGQVVVDLRTGLKKAQP